MGHPPVSPSKEYLKHCETTLAKFKLFCLLTPAQIHELALLTKEVTVDAGVTLVEDGDIVNNFYIILSGKAQVTRKFQTLEKTEMLNIAILKEGDAIGLVKTGFFSQSGIRLGTVTAITPMKLIMFALKDFYFFLEKSGSTYPSLKKMAEKILLMVFIEDTHLFSHLPTIKIKELSEKLKKIELPANTLLFEKGEVANQCYFILSGKVAITISQGDEEHIIKILEPSHFFGEGAFLDEGKRNANARTQTDCVFYVLERAHLNILLLDDTIKKNLDVLRLKQIVPERRANLLMTRQLTAEREEVVQLTTLDKNKQLQLSHLTKEIWEEINGINSLGDILKKNKPNLKGLTIWTLYEEILKLNQMGFLHFVADKVAPKEKTLKDKLKSMINTLRKDGKKS